MAQIKRAKLYIDSLWIGVVMTSEVTLNLNGERIDADEGVIGGSDGNHHVDVSFDAVEPIPAKGSNVKIWALIDSGAEFNFAYQFGGRQISVPMKFSTAVVTSTARTGVVQGKFNAYSTGEKKIL